jgi:hypothetical protein
MFDDSKQKDVQSIASEPAGDSPLSQEANRGGFKDVKEAVSSEKTLKTSPSSVEDIFSDAGKKEKPAVFNPVENETEEDWGISEAELREQNKKKLTVLLIIFIALVFLGAGAYWGFTKVLSMASQANQEQPAENGNNRTPIIDNNASKPPVETKKEEEAPAENQNQASAENGETAVSELDPESGLKDEGDNDRDGLANQEEIELGTNPDKVDSDSDGLFDREEVRVYRTNPLNSDTDSDGFLDGEEVKAGYNPKGEGRLNVIK